MVLTDIVVGFYGSTMLFVYGTKLLISVLSRYLHKDNLQTILGTSVLSVVLWHLIVNLGVYLNGLGTVSLLETYALAIPFDFRLLKESYMNKLNDNFINKKSKKSDKRFLDDYYSRYQRILFLRMLRINIVV